MDDHQLLAARADDATAKESAVVGLAASREIEPTVLMPTYRPTDDLPTYRPTDLPTYIVVGAGGTWAVHDAKFTVRVSDRARGS